MGIGEWTKWYIPASNPMCAIYKIKPGEYLLKYDSSNGDIFLRYPDREEVEHRINLNSILNPALSSEHLEAIERLQGKNYKKGGGGYSNHHIIPHHLCDKSDLVIQAERYGVFKKDGDENLMLLPDEFHKKNHTERSPYSRLLRDVLQQRWSDLVEAGLDEDPDAVKQVILEIVDITKENLTELMKSQGSTIRDV